MYPYLVMIILVLSSGCAISNQPSIPLVLEHVTLKYNNSKPLKSIDPHTYLVVSGAKSNPYKKNKELIHAVKQRLLQRGYFQITDHIDLSLKYPTYILNIDHYVSSPFQRARDAGIRDMHEIDNICGQSDVLISYISLYDPQFYEMKHGFMIQSIAKKSFEPGNKKSFESQLSQQIVNRLDEIITITRKTIPAYIHPQMDSRSRKYLKQFEYRKAKNRLKSILPALDFTRLSIPEIQQKYAQWDRSKLRSLETDLINYYGYFLACEACQVSQKKLHQVKIGYQTILALTESPQLIKACAHALGRIDH